VADIVRDHIRDSDVSGRYGGEEFAILLPDTDQGGALILAERLRQAIEDVNVVHEGEVIRFTISLGVADLAHSARDHQELIEWADQALYASKKAGRNQVSVRS
jgi:diguanylate cyclase (GGDEF)-like protein